MLEEYRDEIEQAVDALEVGDIVLLGQSVAGWEEIPVGERTKLGKEFRSAVINGEFPSLINIGRNAKNHQQYQRV